MQIIKTKLPGVLIIEPKVFGDQRGFFKETFSAQRYAEDAGINLAFVQDNHSRSRKGVLRGLHFQKTKPQGKLVSVTRGAVYDVAADINPESPTYGQYVGVEISEDNRLFAFKGVGKIRAAGKRVGVLRKCKFLHRQKLSPRRAQSYLF